VPFTRYLSFSDPIVCVSSAGTVNGAASVYVRDALSVTGGAFSARVIMQGGGGSAPYNISSSVSLGSVDVSAGANTITQSSALTLGGNLTVNNGTLATANFGITISGNWTVAGAAIFNSGTGTVTFAGGNNQTLTPGGTDINHDFYNIVVGKTGGTVTLAAAIDLNGSMTIQGGTLATANYLIRVTLNWNRPGGGTFGEGTGTVQFLGNGDIDSDTFYNVSITGGTRTTSGAVTVSNNLTLNGAAAVFSPAAAVTVSGSLTLTAGTYNGGAVTHTIAGNWNDSTVSVT